MTKQDAKDILTLVAGAAMMFLVFAGAAIIW